MTTFTVEAIEPHAAAVVHDEVPMADLTAVFDRGFSAVMEVVGSQGLHVTGAPFGYYPRMPGDTVAVAVGFPVSAPVSAAGEVTPFELPGGRAVTAVHVGPYDTLETTYRELTEWAAAEGIELAGHMWETYLTDPSAEPDPANWRTQVTWPLA